MTYHREEDISKDVVSRKLSELEVKYEIGQVGYETGSDIAIFEIRIEMGGKMFKSPFKVPVSIMANKDDLNNYCNHMVGNLLNDLADRIVDDFIYSLEWVVGNGQKPIGILGGN